MTRDPSGPVPTETQTVWKFTLPRADDLVSIEMPKGAEPLFVGEQFGVPCLWARVDPAAPTERRWFRWAGTGHPLGRFTGRHIGTWITHGGNLVWHLFDAMSPTPSPSDPSHPTGGNDG